MHMDIKTSVFDDVSFYTDLKRHDDYRVIRCSVDWSINLTVSSSGIADCSISVKAVKATIEHVIYGDGDQDDETGQVEVDIPIGNITQRVESKWSSSCYPHDVSITGDLSDPDGITADIEF